MNKKIDRRVLIGDKVFRIRASSEEEYADKLFAAMASAKGMTAVGDSSDSPTGPKGHDFAKYAMKWFEVYSKPNIERVTAISYEHQLKVIWIPAFKGKCVEDITTADIQAVFNDMGKVAKDTKVKARMVLNMVLEQALEDEYITRNPLKSRNLRLGGRAAKVTVPYTVEQMQYLISHIDDIKLASDRAFLAVIALHPLRLEEVLGLKVEDIDVNMGVIHVRRAVTHPARNQPEIKATKTAASRRDIALVPEIVKYLTAGSPSDFVFGGENPLSYTQVRRLLNRIAKDTGFDDQLSPRRFRTTVLTDIYDTTKDIKQAQAAAGHTTSAMTLKHYVKGRDKMQDTASAVAGLYGIH